MEKEVITQAPNIILELVKVFIPALITIIGFIVTYFLTRSSIRKEIENKKTNIHLNELSKVPLETLQLLDFILNNKNDNSLINRMQDLMAKIFAYGTKDAINIISSMQEYNYGMVDNKSEVSNHKAIAYYIILACQVKYDLTGIEINPEQWYKMRLTDYMALKSELAKVTNEIVEELKLRDFLKVE